MKRTLNVLLINKKTIHLKITVYTILTLQALGVPPGTPWGGKTKRDENAELVIRNQKTNDADDRFALIDAL